MDLFFNSLVINLARPFSICHPLISPFSPKSYPFFQGTSNAMQSNRTSIKFETHPPAEVIPFKSICSKNTTPMTLFSNAWISSAGHGTNTFELIAVNETMQIFTTQNVRIQYSGITPRSRFKTRVRWIGRFIYSRALFGNLDLIHSRSVVVNGHWLVEAATNGDKRKNLK